LSRDEDVVVIRGKQGAMQQVNIWDLVVGDVAILDKTPADCIIISSQNLKVQESKDPSQNSIFKDEHSDPFLKADSFIQEGTCRVLVTAVGIHSTRGIIDERPELNEGTPLQ
jgi:magnesium-transporting ATPase (P-type)